MIHRSKLMQGCVWFAIVAATAATAQATATLTFSPAPDGGVELVASGDAVQAFPFDNNFTIILEVGVDNVLGPDGGLYFADSFSGSITVGPDTGAITSARLRTQSTEDSIRFDVDTSLDQGLTSFNNITAT